MLRIGDIDVDDRDFRLHGEAAAKGFGRLVFIHGGCEIHMIPLCSVKPRPATHRRDFSFLPTWERAPPSLS
jgi:hypothetical protein